jgi:hypothetical protein
LKKTEKLTVIEQRKEWLANNFKWKNAKQSEKGGIRRRRRKEEVLVKKISTLKESLLNINKLLCVIHKFLYSRIHFNFSNPAI